MLKPRVITAISALSAILLMSTASISFATGNPAIRDVSSYTCKDVMRLSGDDRDVSVGFLHGWWMAKTGQTKINKHQIAIVTDKFIEQCLDNPKDIAVDAMGKFAK